MNPLLINSILDTYTQELSRLQEIGWALDVRHLDANRFQVTGKNNGEGSACKWVEELLTPKEARSSAWVAIAELCSN